ncbi:MAG: GNAT family N-acetyltransferase [Polyangiaceae bacterium]
MSRKPEMDDASARVPVLTTPRLLLTLPPPDAADRHLRFAEENRAHLTPWEPPPAADHFTLGFWRERLRKNLIEHEKGLSVRFSIFWKDAPDGPVLGNCNFGNIVWGAFHCATLGYRLAHASEGRGVMTEALSAALTHMFEDRGFHRIQANYRPENARSAAVLRRLGFVVEGFARDYLFIDGAWRDHILTSLTNPHMEGRPPRLA